MARHTWIRPLLPWLLASLLLAVMLWRIPVEAFVAALEAARIGPFLGLVGAACIGWFLIDSAAFSYLFSRFNAPLTFSQARELRGLTYLLTPIHWNVGRAAVIARLHRTHRVPILEATSSMALYQTLDAILLAFLCWIGLAQMLPDPTIDWLRPIVAGVCIALVSYLVVIRSPYPRLHVFERLRRMTLHRSHRLATHRDVLSLLAFRGAYYSIFVCVYFFGARTFGFDLPLAIVIASVPIIQAIGALPISPAGFGTQQAAMLYLFAGHAEPAAIIAFGMSFPILSIAIRSLIGWAYLPRLADRRREQGSVPASSDGSGGHAGMQTLRPSNEGLHGSRVTGHVSEAGGHDPSS